MAITYHQKLSLLRSISKLCSDPQTLVEIYLNYDCDPQALDNTFERLVNILSKMMTSRDSKLLQVGPPLPAGVDLGLDFTSALSGSNSSYTFSITVPSATAGPRSSSGTTESTSASATSPGPSFNTPALGPLAPEKDQSIKFRAVECVASILKSMVAWSRSYTDTLLHDNMAVLNGDRDKTAAPSPLPDDIPDKPQPSDEFNRFEAAKHQKQAIKEGIRMFNWKFKKGIQYLIDNGIIHKNQKEIAQFLLHTPGLNKRNIGEYLGEGEEWNIGVMHAFVDLMDFTNMRFVAALREFLQSFRLPGEAQKIDRFMLKFAERFLLNNATAFTNADCAYVLAYSTIMLNTDLHNPQIKKRMTKAEFIRNNRGINDGKNLADEYLEVIYDEISTNEIKMKDEHEAAAQAKAASSAKTNSDYGNMSSKQKKEAFLAVSEEIATRSEAVFKGISATNAERKGVDALPFHVARHAEHVRLMFEVSWMPILVGVSAPLQEVDMSDAQSAQLIMTAFRCAIHLSSIFELDTARNAFASTLNKYAFLSSSSDFILKPKLVECIRAILDVGFTDGNWIKGTWLDVFRCVSQVERLMSSNKNSENVIVPGVAIGSGDGKVGGPGGAGKPRPTDTDPALNRPLTAQEETQAEAISQSLLIAMDRIFTSSNRLNGVRTISCVAS